MPSTVQLKARLSLGPRLAVHPLLILETDTVELLATLCPIHFSCWVQGGAQGAGHCPAQDLWFPPLPCHLACNLCQLSFLPSVSFHSVLPGAVLTQASSANYCPHLLLGPPSLPGRSLQCTHLSTSLRGFCDLQALWLGGGGGRPALSFTTLLSLWACRVTVPQGQGTTLYPLRCNPFPTLAHPSRHTLNVLFL